MTTEPARELPVDLADEYDEAERCSVCGHELPSGGCGVTDCPTGMWAGPCEICGDENCLEDTHG